MNTANFLPSALVFLATIAILPRFEDINLVILISIFYGVVFSVLIGAKNLLFLRRDIAYYLVHVSIIAALCTLFFSDLLIVRQVAAFVAFFIISRELFANLCPGTKQNFFGLISAFLSSQFLWAISLMPTNFLGKAAVATFTIFLLNDFLVHHIQHRLTKFVILRSLLILVLAFAITFQY